MVCSLTLTLRTGRLVLHSYEDSLTGNTVHVYASARFEIVKVGGSPTTCEFQANKLQVVKVDASHSTFNTVGGNQTNETAIDR